MPVSLKVLIKVIQITILFFFTELSFEKELTSHKSQAEGL